MDFTWGYFLIVLVASVTSLPNDVFRIPYSDDNLHIYALPMGEGESTVIQCPGGDIILVDMGSSGNGWTKDRVYQFLLHQLERVKTVIISNTSPEHYNYIPTVLRTVSGLQQIVIGGRSEYYEADRDFSSWLEVNNKKVNFLNSGEPCITDCDISTISCGDEAAGVQLNVLGSNLAQNHSNSGVILQLVSQEFKLLLPGDFTGHDMEELIIYEWNLVGFSLSSSHFKLSKHGSADRANGESFLLAISPNYAFSSNAYPNNYDGWDPDCDIVWRLLNLQSIRKSKYVDSYSCGDSNDHKPVRYNNWPYEIHSTSVDQYLGKLIRINVNTTDPINSKTSPQIFYVSHE
ncbi:hypothetical protein LOD99_15017 [Oopsacas minuta]|uniref:Metallo-beta-lactamase domain-containing protein n=1 Tax=Oopsacas minuta TaxID=111878 RepID=A0AAV7KD46_9METZ|nr:hypothetical protein LOD99_15017 [Oopsacas minuta]